MSHPLQGVVVATGVARRAQGETHLGLDHTERGAQFRGGVSGELQLTSAGLFDGAGRLQPDDECAQIGGEKEDRTGDELTGEQHLLHARLLGQAFSGHQPSTVDGRCLHPEGMSLDGDGDRSARYPFHGGQRWRPVAQCPRAAAGFDLPQDNGGGVDIVVIVRFAPRR